MYNNIITYIIYKGSGSLLCLCKRFEKKMYINNNILQTINIIINIFIRPFKYIMIIIKLKYIFP